MRTVSQFIERWECSGAAERANYQLFLSELCDVLEVPHPDPATPDNRENAYVFERSITFQDSTGTGTTNFIDLYKRGCFVLEAKQGTEKLKPDATPLSETERTFRTALRKGAAYRGTKSWDQAMLRARGQGEKYIRALPAAEGRPPFLVVVDVGHSIELYSEFTCTGGNYIPFPAPGSHRIFLRDLENPEIRDRLRLVWTEPAALDPSRRSARVTTDIAERLARLAMSLEHPVGGGGGQDPQTVATFLMRCLFTMFAQDVYLLPRGAFTRLLEGLRETPEYFAPMAEELWEKMNRGGFSTSLRQPVWQFNGGLFADNQALPLNQDQLLLLIEAAQCDWRDVEPAIFGTLLERALDPVERHKLGAHYTPRAYVERLVLETIVNPVRAEWAAVEAAAAKLIQNGQPKKAVSEVMSFHRGLCNLRVLDPACGSGNFLYVTLEHLKRLEGEIFDLLDRLGQTQASFEMPEHAVYPNQLLGLEINPRAAAITELVLWIGTLQWHFRNRGAVRPPQPIIRNFHNIECRDALIEWDDMQPVLDDDGNPFTRWDGHTTKPHPITGREVPDETARIPVAHYVNPRKTTWPDAEFVVGNPPFIGPARMRDALGDGYTEAVRKTHGDVGESSDFVMYWWNYAAELTRAGRLRRFGLVSTNSLRQKFNRRTLERHMTAKNPLSLVYAIPDHPWVDAADGADVRIAMTVGARGELPGLLQTVTHESANRGDHYDVTLAAGSGKIHADLTIGPDVASAEPLAANRDLSSRGICLFGSGFIVTPEEAKMLGLGRIAGLEQHIRPYLNGRDLTQTSRDVLCIDLFGLNVDEVRRQFPEVYQWVKERVKPERDQNRDGRIREDWWLSGRPRPELRKHIRGLSRYIATVETSKHRFFVFLEESILPDNKLIAIALEDSFFLGILSSKLHVIWALNTGGRLGVGNDPVYVKTRCFETFPFPAASEEQKERIRAIAGQLDAHRKRQQSLHPELTLTDMYNVLAKLRRQSQPCAEAVAGPAAADSTHSNEGSGESMTPRRGSGGSAPASAAPGSGVTAAGVPAVGVTLTDKEKTIYEHGLIGVLKELHDDLDRAAFDAYGWPHDLDDTAILERLVALNKQRIADEQQGIVHWLRPEYQNPEFLRERQQDLGLDTGHPVSGATAPVTPARKQAWPKKVSDRIRAVHAVLNDLKAPLDAEAVARHFIRAPRAQVQDLLDTLANLGQLHRLADGRYETNPEG